MSVPDQAVVDHVSGATYGFEGHVDFYGGHSRAGGWFVGGWITHPWPTGCRPGDAVAEFADGALSDHTHSLFYHRDDVRGRGIGFVFFLQSSQILPRELLSVRIVAGGTTHKFHPTPDVLCLGEQQLIEHLQDLLADGDKGSQRQEMQALLVGDSAPQAAEGFVDCYGHHSTAAGWLLCGWMTVGWPEGRPPERIVLSFEEGDVAGEALATLHPRADLQGHSRGLVFFVRGTARLLGRLCSVTFNAGGLRAVLYVAATAQRLRDTELVSRLRPILNQTLPDRHRDALVALLARQPYRGEDTLKALAVAVFLEIDDAILSGADGLVLVGWCLVRANEIREIRVRCGPLVAPLDLRTSMRIDRPDVVEGFAQHGFDDPSCGFIAFLPNIVMADGRIHIEVETAGGEIGYCNVPPAKLQGIGAIRHLLSAADARFTEVQAAFDNILGPAIEGLNRSRLASRPEVTVIEYGQVAGQPRFSVIVPLHGRLDFVEYQLALFSAQPSSADVEFLFVLDDPPKRREAQFLFASVYERFLTPFKALLLDRNMGFAPANNIGLEHARGRYVCYLNSDVFPGSLDWLERLAERLEADPHIGVIGPLLLFEDRSIQHRGMFFTRLPEFGNWFFGQHFDKGRHFDKGARDPGGGGLETHLSITGACMLLRRELAEELGGFDEVFVIGDFEDSDLCLNLQQRGYRCVVDTAVHLFHLERKSQASSGVGWRMNLTLYNAWQHERRWGKTIAAHQAGVSPA